ncbi:hypothetical protein Golob_027561, partial [Gossypium lobatum]|nr:hypothetical protein [Gossypium lobatum]
NADEARYFASLVPLFNCLRLVIHGLSLTDDQSLIKSVTREGNPNIAIVSNLTATAVFTLTASKRIAHPNSPVVVFVPPFVLRLKTNRELLRGPLYYVAMLMLCALVFWRESPVGVICLAMMCGGDGVADIIGRKYGSSKIPYNQSKSWVGSISMFVSGFIISIGMLYYYSALGYLQLDWGYTMHRVAFISLVATVVESLPITMLIDDNISVPLASMLAAYLT